MDESRSRSCERGPIAMVNSGRELLEAPKEGLVRDLLRDGLGHTARAARRQDAVVERMLPAHIGLLPPAPLEGFEVFVQSDLLQGWQQGTVAGRSGDEARQFKWILRRRPRVHARLAQSTSVERSGRLKDLGEKLGYEQVQTAQIALIVAGVEPSARRITWNYTATQHSAFMNSTCFSFKGLAKLGANIFGIAPPGEMAIAGIQRSSQVPKPR